MLNGFKRRYLAGFLAFTMTFGGGMTLPQKAKANSAESSTSASTKAGIGAGILTSVIGSVIAGMAPRIIGEIIVRVDKLIEQVKKSKEVAKYAGFRDTPEIVKKLEDICNGKSDVRVYGQEMAKQQMFDFLSGVAARIDDLKREKHSKKDIRGNIAYIIGPSGTGKTEMCYAIADAFLKHPEKSCIFCHSESITSEAELGTQLFKTVTTKDIGEKRQKNWFTGHDGLVPKDEESPMLKHLLQWYESVVIIDEYDKMKQKSAKPGTTMTIQGVTVPLQNAPTSSVDNSADEIFRSIASTGKYKFMNKEVDCSKTLFLITTNETREELEANFGINGIKGGGAQRLNIIEFDYLSKEACRSIIDDMVDKVIKSLTSQVGPYKLAEVSFSEESRDLMAECMFNDKITQGRLKNKFEDEIRGLMARSMGKDYGKKAEIIFSKNSEDGKFEFSKKLGN